MNCERVTDLLSEAIDGTLSSNHKERFHTHLADCPQCRLSFGEMREALALLAEDLRLAARAVGGITGAIGVEDLLDRIFATFCIGK